MWIRRPTRKQIARFPTSGALLTKSHFTLYPTQLGTHSSGSSSVKNSEEVTFNNVPQFEVFPLESFNSSIIAPILELWCSIDGESNLKQPLFLKAEGHHLKDKRGQDDRDLA
uniref:Ovule protein n=1 Tax=Steinernema glaseri TaxID=37863 RepID=A0A1I8AU93_9BILA